MRVSDHIDVEGPFLIAQDDRGETFWADLEDRELLEAHRWRVYNICPPYGRYAIMNERCKTTLFHRLIMNAPRHLTVDHIDGNPLNNRRRNLRICTMAQNIMNKNNFKRGKSGYRGVYEQKNGSYSAIISHDDRLKYLGNFDNPIDAAIVWDAEALRLRGEFAVLNFPR